ncbi:MAG: hypothetical protein EBT20_03610 [Alphaproteobacteria bacterium]|nr:hypothetical protein [Alphaproteobacteria bacterium]
MNFFEFRAHLSSGSKNKDENPTRQGEGIRKMSDGTRDDHVNYYGPWAWLAGLAFGAGLMALMFYVADGFL